MQQNFIPLNNKERSPIPVNLNRCSINILNSNGTSRPLLHEVNTIIDGGSMFAILGGSGSGKTTLLNVIANRYDKKSFQINGSIDIEGSGNAEIGYVTQQDFLLPYLTVRETVLFTAKMRVAPNDQRLQTHTTKTSYQLELERITDEIILDLGLRECANTRIGDDNLVFGTRGVSGGERRRVSIAVQVITDPAILCADEPTSGLDSFTAITVIESLQRLTTHSTSKSTVEPISMSTKDSETAQSNNIKIDDNNDGQNNNKYNNTGSSTHHHNTTVICSIHQPRADVFHMFDSILLLSRGGYPIYCGPTQSIYSYFEQLGYHCPFDSNPADYFVDISSIDSRSKYREKEGMLRVNALSEEYRKYKLKEGKEGKEGKGVSTNLTQNDTPHEEVVSSSSSSSSSSLSYSCPWRLQVWHLTGRFFTNIMRSKAHVYGGFLQALLLGIVIMAIFWDLSNSLNDIKSRNGLMYLCPSIECYIIMLILVERYCSELVVFDREIQDKMYQPSAYLVAHIISSIPLLLIQPIIFSITLYWGCNLRGVNDITSKQNDNNTSYEHVLVFIAINIMCCLVTNGLAWWSVSIHRNFSVASLIANTNYTFITLGSGYLVNLSQVPTYLRWIKHISYLNYSYKILMSNEFSNRIFSGCPSSISEECNQYIGNDILATQGVKSNDYKGLPWIWISLICVVYYLFTFICLTYIKFPVTGVVGGDSGNGEFDDEDDDNGDNDEDNNVIDVNNSPFIQNSDIKAHINNPLTDKLLPPETKESSSNENKEEETVKDIESNVLTTPHYVQSNPVSVSIQNITVSVMLPKEEEVDENTKVKTRKIILSNVSAEIQPCRLVALMGGSGSGKSTLLNILAGRIGHNCINQSKPDMSGYSPIVESRMENEEKEERNIEKDSINKYEYSTCKNEYEGKGSILFNHQMINHETLRQLLGYVQQFDFHYPMLTVKETLLFHANLKFYHLNLSSQLKLKEIQRVINVLGLKQCENTRVGGSMQKGISGGELRRLSIGCQLLVDPAVLLLDEPTTGLDAFTSRAVVETLQNLANVGGRTVIMSIHQPRYDIFGLLDDVLLLAKGGEQVWYGSSSNMLQHLNSLKFPCPKLMNPADYILDLTSIDYRSLEQEIKTKKRLFFLINEYDSLKQQQNHSKSNNNNENNNETNNNEGVEMIKNDIFTSSNEQPSLLFTMKLLLHRSYLNTIRRPIIASTRISQGLFFALILCGFYAPIGHNQNSIQNRIGCLYELTALCFIGMLSCIAIFPDERNVFYREYIDGTYSAYAFILSYYIIAIPLVIFTSILIAFLMTYAIGLKNDLESFIMFTYVVFCFMFVGECIGVIFCAMFIHVGFSVNIMSLVIGITNQFTGFVSLSIPKWLNLVGDLSPMKWGSILLSNEIMKNEIFTCSKNEEISNGQCPLSTGSDVLKLYNMNFNNNDQYNNQTYFIYVFGLITGSFFICSILVFRLKALKLSH